LLAALRHDVVSAARREKPPHGAREDRKIPERRSIASGLLVYV
jgi:hypothetical protein